MTVYDDRFYAGQQLGSRRSAARVVPLVLELTGARTVVDIGCGRGGWLAEFLAAGMDDALGVDGEHVSPADLEIPPERFAARDLARPLELGRRFDLAISLEVAEHLPPERGPGFVADLARLAPLVLFSAAVPGQSGEGHVNERWQDEWAELFAEQGLTPVDCIRRRVWDDPQVEWWYAQNTLLYVAESELAGRPALAAERVLMGAAQLRLVHPRYVEWREHVGAGPLRKALRRLARS